ncbi:UDP-GalNAc:beta-1,3-N-acetylgalactosaminyltransferase 1-like [Dermacentor albipictus]|uniref:UDP-GalNAc:beta-1, 3-N-acetylgalactosaminyltransferase 1-like n=1 Tax=Dermacentor albipictus TaxID=60249 RepID=UPI0038FCF9BE
MEPFSRSRNKRKFLVIAVATLSSIILMAQIRMAEIATAPHPVHRVVEQQERRTTLPTEQLSEDKAPRGCQHRVDSLDGPGPDQEWHSGGWAVRQLCSQPLDTLFFVHTAPTHWERRAVLRATLFEEAARTAFNWTGIFFIGNHEDPLVNMWTTLEVGATGDVVMLPYNDTFFTIIYKFVGGMRWVTEYCPNVRTIVKIDDDVGVEPFQLRQYLDKELPKNSDSIHCSVFVDNDVRREANDTYCVPEDDLVQNVYPLYCSGRSMIMTMETLRKLFAASKIVKGYAIDDAYVTGHLALFSNVGHVDISSRIDWNFTGDTESMVRGKVTFTHEESAKATSTDRRGQWGLMLWMHMMQAPGWRALNFSNRLADSMYRRDFLKTRHSLKKGHYLLSRSDHQEHVVRSSRSAESVKR